MYTIAKSKPKTFDFQIEGQKKTYSVPLLRELPLEMVIKAEDLKEDASDLEALSFIKGIFDEYAPGVVDKLSAEQFGLLFQAYLAAAENDVSLGE